MSVVCGGEYDRWDLQVRVGPLAAARLRLTAEEHGQGNQLVRIRVWPRLARGLSVLLLVLITICLLAINSGDVLSALLLGVVTILLTVRAAREHAGAMTAVQDVFAVHMLEAPERHAPEAVVEPPRSLTHALANGNGANGRGANGSGANGSGANGQPRTPFRSQDDRWAERR